jgi:tetratricopeptide (TPR) repeat protein
MRRTDLLKPNPDALAVVVRVTEQLGKGKAARPDSYGINLAYGTALVLEGHLRCAVGLSSDDVLDAGMRTLDVAAAMQAESPEPPLVKGIGLLLRAQESGGDSEDLEAAQRALDQAGRLRPDNSTVLLWQGTCAKWQQRNPEAVAYYRRAIELDQALEEQLEQEIRQLSPEQ